jgi:hypothetical protein
MSHDPFRDWLVEHIDELEVAVVRNRSRASGGSFTLLSEKLWREEARYILARYDAEMAATAKDNADWFRERRLHFACLAEKVAAATKDDGTVNHANTAETARTGDPDDPGAYDAAVRRHVETIRHHIADAVAKRDMGQQGAVTIAARAIAALPAPVRGDEQCEH